MRRDPNWWSTMSSFSSSSSWSHIKYSNHNHSQQPSHPYTQQMSSSQWPVNSCYHHHTLYTSLHTTNDQWWPDNSCHHHHTLWPDNGCHLHHTLWPVNGCHITTHCDQSAAVTITTRDQSTAVIITTQCTLLHVMNQQQSPVNSCCLHYTLNTHQMSSSWSPLSGCHHYALRQITN